MYRLMVLAREFDRKMLSLQRQGRIGTYPMLEGQEAVQIGSALALAENDFVFPSYREHGVQLARGSPDRSRDVLLARAAQRGLGRPQIPDGHHRQSRSPANCPTPSATPTSPSCGATICSRRRLFRRRRHLRGRLPLRHELRRRLARRPTVFICANNLYAISVPYEKQTASATIAQKADGYGFPGVRVDGMDVLAMYQVTKEALDRARRGDGPTLIEAMTYRYGAHATADDARRYRSADEETVVAKTRPDRAPAPLPGKGRALGRAGRGESGDGSCRPG